MSVTKSAPYDIGHLDDLAARDTAINHLHPQVKLLTTLAFLVVVASFSKYDLTGLLPLVLYPIVLVNLGDLPSGRLLVRLVLAAPFVLFIGAFNPLLDRTVLMRIGPVPVTGGWVSLVIILVKFTLSVLAALILLATSGFHAICAALARMRLPRVFVLQLLFTYRYLHVLIEEAGRMIRAHALRSPRGKGVQPGAWGSLGGQLLLRTLDRAQRIHQAMLCRGFDGEIRLARTYELRGRDVAYLLGWCFFFLFVRLVNIPQWLGALLLGASR